MILREGLAFVILGAPCVPLSVSLYQMKSLHTQKASPSKYFSSMLLKIRSRAEKPGSEAALYGRHFIPVAAGAMGHSQMGKISLNWQ
jgi:hypothetical protein